MIGTIKNLVPERGFGFIRREKGQPDVFFHRSSLVGVDIDDLQVGDSVNFSIEHSAKGPRAADVTRA